MTNKKNISLLYILLIIEIIILLKSNIVIKSVLASLKMFTIKVFPSLFPTMIVGNLLVRNNIWLIIPKIVKKIFNKLFNFNDIMTSIFFISLLTGTPSNGIYINYYEQKGLLTRCEASNLLSCTHFINPLFVIYVVGKGVFESYIVGFIILLFILLDNLLKAYILRNSNSKNKKKTELIQNKFISTLNSSIKTSISSLLMILSIIIIFNILLSLINNLFNVNSSILIFFNSILEMTSGVISTNGLTINYYLKVFILYYILNFGGLSIHMQTMSMIKNKKIRYLKYLIFRMF